MRKLIKNGLVLKKNIRDGFCAANVVIDGSEIVYVGNDVAFENIDEEIDASHCVLIPGLVNAHLHSHDHFNKGTFDNLPLELWMPLLRPYRSGIMASADDIYVRTLYGCIEMLKTGTTMIIDDVLQTPFNDEEKLDAIFRAYRKAGIRAYVTTHIGNKPIEETIPYLKEGFQIHGFNNDSFVMIPEDEILCYVEANLRKYNKCNSIQKYAVAPSGAQRCTSGLLNGLVSLAQKYQVPAVCHMLETYMQKLSGSYFFDKSLVSYMNDIGALNEYVNLIHCVWVTDDDIEIIRDKKAKVVHNPSSNLKLGSGVAPIRKFIDAGIAVGLGTDNTSSNDSLNLFFEMRAAALIHKICTRNYQNWLGAADALYMATLGGASCASMDHNVGTIECGKIADISIIDVNNERYYPSNNFINHIVFADSGSSVKHVLVNGDFVLKDGKITGFDEKEVMDEIKEMMPRIHDEQKLAETEAVQILPSLEYAYSKANATEY